LGKEGAVFIQEAHESEVHTTNPDNTKDGRCKGAMVFGVVKCNSKYAVGSERDD
jgi:hypothetical protein